MRVIGTGKGDLLICEVGHHELEKFMNLYHGKMDRLKIGDTVDLGRGYDFAAEARSAMGATDRLIQSHAAVVRSITEGVTLCSRLSGGENG